MSNKPLKFGEAGPEIQRLREENQHLRDAKEGIREQWAELLKDNAAKAAEMTRLRTAINNALLEPWLDGQLNGTWHQEPIGPNETPEEAVKRLVSVRAEWAVYKNNCENPVIAELRAALATARRDALAEIKQDTDELIEQGRQDGMEQAAQIADGRPSDCGEDIAAAIRAAAGETDHSEWPLDESPETTLRRVIRNCAVPIVAPRVLGVPRWSVVSDVTAHGSTYSAALCRWAGGDPDELVRARK